MIKDKMTTNYYKVLEILYDNLVVIDGEQVSIMTQVNIAKKTGLTTVTVNSIFKELKEDGLIRQNKKLVRFYCLSEEAINIVKKMKRVWGMWFMKFKEFVHNQGLTMGEFRRLDKETQENWRRVHQIRNREEQILFNQYYKEHLASLEIFNNEN